MPTTEPYPTGSTPEPAVTPWAPPPFICRRPAQPGDDLAGRCPDPNCGHAVIVHVGTSACPVCEILTFRDWLLERAASDARQQQPEPDEVRSMIQGFAHSRRFLDPSTHPDGCRCAHCYKPPGEPG